MCNVTVQNNKTRASMHAGFRLLSLYWGKITTDRALSILHFATSKYGPTVFSCNILTFLSATLEGTAYLHNSRSKMAASLEDLVLRLENVTARLESLAQNTDICKTEKQATASEITENCAEISKNSEPNEQVLDAGTQALSSPIFDVSF